MLVRENMDRRLLPLALIAVLVAFVLPYCLMSLCGPAIACEGSSGIGAMHSLSDIPLVVLVQALVLAVAIVAFARFVLFVQSVQMTLVRVVETDPDPPDDPLRGRLLL